MTKRFILLLSLCACASFAGTTIVQRRFWPVYVVAAASDLPGFSDTVAWYEFNEEAGGGTNAAGKYVDSSSVGTNVATPGAGAAQPTWVTATNTISDHLSFDGGDDADMPLSIATGLLGSVSAWVRPTSTNSTYAIVSSGDEASDSRSIMFSINKARLQIFAQNDDTADNLKSDNEVVSEGVWQHVVYTSGGSSYTVYIDGSPVAMTAGTGADNGRWFGDIDNRDNHKMGHRLLNSFDDFYLNGGLDDLIEYTNDITSAQVEDLFWLQATNHGWSVFDYDNKTLWSNAVFIGTFEYDNPADTSPQGNHGTKGAGAAAPTFESDTTNGWYSFDGGDEINLQNVYDSTDNSLSIAAWIRPSDTSSTHTIWQQNGVSETNGQMNLLINKGRLQFTALTTGGLLNYTTLEIVTEDEWQHVCLVVDGVTRSDVSMYLNGVTQAFSGGSDGGGNFIAGGTHNIGVIKWDGSSYFQGDIDAARFYTNAITAAQVTNMYHSTTNRYGGL